MELRCCVSIGGDKQVTEHAFFANFPKDTPRGYAVEVTIPIAKIDDYYATVLSKLETHVVQKLALKPWGKKDFRLKDPFGFYLRFTRTIGDDVMIPVLDILDRAALPENRKLLIKEALETSSLADVACSLGIPNPIAALMHEAYKLIQAPATVRTYGDECYIKSITATKVLVTSGYRKFQKGKICKLGIAIP